MHNEKLYYGVFLIDGPAEYHTGISAVLSSLLSVDDRLETTADSETFLLKRPYKIKPDNDTLLGFASQLSDTISAEAMCRVLIGFERCDSSDEDQKTAVLHAKIAVDIGRRFDLKSPILPYYDLGLAKLIYFLPDDAKEEYLRDNLGSFSFSMLDSETMTTIHTFFETGLSLAKTAKALYIHRNTLNYRIDKFQKLSGLNLRKFDDAVVCQIAMLISG